MTDGLARDARAPCQAAFGVRSQNRSARQQGRGKVIASDVPVECGGVPVCPGDLVFCDADGVIVVPREIEGGILRAALEKPAGEGRTRAALERGEELADGSSRHGVP